MGRARLVGRRGIEPPRPCGLRILSPMRLPIPPPPHFLRPWWPRSAPRSARSQQQFESYAGSWASPRGNWPLTSGLSSENRWSPSRLVPSPPAGLDRAAPCCTLVGPHQRRRSQVAKATDCKSVIHRFESGRRLHFCCALTVHGWVLLRTGGRAVAGFAVIWQGCTPEHQDRSRAEAHRVQRTCAWRVHDPQLARIQGLH